MKMKINRKTTDLNFAQLLFLKCEGEISVFGIERNSFFFFWKAKANFCFFLGMRARAREII